MFLCVAVVLVVSLAGCASDMPVAVQPLTPIVSNQPIAPVPLMENMTVYQWKADYARLVDDIERAMNDEEWALLKQEERDGAIHAAGVLPDNRHAWLIVWPVGDDGVAMGVRVGLFGAVEHESKYAARLKLVMAGKPKPQRNWSFELPKLPELGQDSKKP